MRASGILAAALVVPLLAGCAYGEARGRDFAEIWKAEGDFGYGLKGIVRMGDVLHLGVGGSWGWRGGLDYGKSTLGTFEEYAFPVGSVLEAMEKDSSLPLLPPFWFIHDSRYIADGPNWQTPQCSANCYGFLPILAPHHANRTALHAFDVEAALFAIFVGADAGVSPGELVDFLAGVFTLDLDPKPPPVPPRRPMR